MKKKSFSEKNLRETTITTTFRAKKTEEEEQAVN